MTPDELCAWCSIPLGDAEHILRFEGRFYHPGCLIQHRLELRATGSVKSLSTAKLG